MGFDVDEFNVHNLTNRLQQLEASRKHMLGEVQHFGKLLLVMTAPNAVSERSFFGSKQNQNVSAVYHHEQQVKSYDDSACA